MKKIVFGIICLQLFFLYSPFIIKNGVCLEINKAEVKTLSPKLNIGFSLIKGGFSSKSEVNKIRQNNGSDNQNNYPRLTRGFVSYDKVFNGDVSAAIEKRIKAGMKPKVLILGAGRGVMAVDLKAKYGLNIDITLASLEDLLFSDEEFRMIFSQKIKDNSADNSFFASADLSEKELISEFILQMRQNFYLFDMDAPWPFEENQFDVIIFSQQTTPFVKGKLKILEKAKKALKRKGEAFCFFVNYELAFMLYKARISLKAIIRILGSPWSDDYFISDGEHNWDRSIFNDGVKIHIINNHTELVHIPFDLDHLAKLKPYDAKVRKECPKIYGAYYSPQDVFFQRFSDLIGQNRNDDINENTDSLLKKISSYLRASDIIHPYKNKLKVLLADPEIDPSMGGFTWEFQQRIIELESKAAAYQKTTLKRISETHLVNMKKQQSMGGFGYNRLNSLKNRLDLFERAI